MCHGTVRVPLTTLLADTVLAHGATWTRRHYVRKLPPVTLNVLMQSPPVQRAIRARSVYERLTQA